MSCFDWQEFYSKEKPISDGDIRIVNLPVKVVFEFSDKIISDYDSETDKILEYKKGYVMRVLPEQSFIFENDKSIFFSRNFNNK